jgi:hypothetical protein
MDQESRILNIYLSRILSGSYVFLYKHKKYKLSYPDISIKYEAELYAEEEYQKNKYNDWISQDEILLFLVDLGLWSYSGDDELKKIENRIEDTKIDLFNNFLNPKAIKSLKKTLSNLNKTYDRLYNQRHSLDGVTLEGYVNQLKNQYILINSLYDENNQKIFTNIDNIDYCYFDTIQTEINKNIIDITTFRKIARYPSWKTYWSANKDTLFDKPTTEWTDEQKTLVVFSKMYDSATEHPDCPPDSVIEDDDMFDGWMAIQKREGEKNKAKNRTEKMLKGKNIHNAKEVFLMANSKEEAQNIYSLNDNTSRNIIKERNSLIKDSNQDIKESDLPDVKRDLVVQNNQQFINSRKGR